MPVILVLTFSVLLQFSAAFFALRLVKVTGKTYSWIFISAALFFMGVRRIIPLSHLIFVSGNNAPDLESEIVALFISFLMFFGVMKIRPFFMERNRAEEALRKSEDKFKYVFEHSIIGKSITLPSGEIFVNEALYKLLGYSPEELQNKKWQDVTHPDDIELTRQALDPIYSGEKDSARFIKRYIHKNGSVIWGDVGTSLRRDEEGKPLYFMTSVNDITDRKLAEEALRQSEQLFRGIVENATDIIYTATLEGIFTYVSPAWLDLIGEPAAEAIGKSFTLYVHPDDVAIVWEHLKISNKTEGLVKNVEFRGLHRDGSIRWLSPMTSAIRDINGNITGFMGIARNITDRKQAEDALQNSERLLFNIYNTTGDVIFYLAVEANETYRFLSVNKAFLKVTGLREKMVVGKIVNEVIPEPSLSIVLGKYRQAIKENSIIRWEEISAYPAGRLTGEVSVSPVVDDKGRCTHLVGSVHDITGHKRMMDLLVVSETRYRRLFESAKDGILILSSETGKILDVNPFMIELLGYSHEQFIEKAIWEIGFFKDIIANKDKFQELQQKGYVRYEDLPLETNYGRKIYVEFVSNVYLVDHLKVIQCNIRDITKRKQAEDDLRKSEELFRNLFRQHAAVKLIIDPGTGAIIDANEAAVNYYGWTYEQVTAMNIQDINILPPEEVKAAMEKVRDRKSTHFEFQHRRADGSVRDVDVFSSNIKFQGKDILHSIIHDISGQKQAMKELKFRNLLLLTQQETSLDGILIIDEAGKINSCNKRFMEMWGISPEKAETMSGDDILRSSMHLLIEPERYFEKVNYLFEHTNETSHDEIYFLDGRYFERYSAPIVGSDGIYYGRVWYFHDTTIRKENEKELKRYHDHLGELVKERTGELISSRNMLRTLIDSLPDEIYAKDSESRFIMANNHVLYNFGFSQFEDILGKTDLDLLPREEAMKAYEMEHSVLHDGQMNKYEEHIIGTDGKIRWLEVTKVPMRDREGNITGLVGINRDITHIKESEDTLETAKQVAESANLAKSTFLSSMSHEIRTPLNAILGFSQLMQGDDTLSKEHNKWLQTINKSGEHLLALINDILEVSRIEAGRITFNPSSFDLHAMLREIEEMFRIKTDAKNLTLLFEHSDELPRYVVTDEAKLRQIIINLVGNAVKFTGEGGIALRSRVKHENEKMRLVVEVEDTGPGIAEKDMDKLFQKFGQAEAGIREGGTGLGLAISQQYAKLMGGIITVKSEEGKGTCFILTIDIDNSEMLIKEENQKRRVVGLKPGQKQYRILIADDRADNREFLKVMLTSVGFEVEEARDGNDTIAKFKIWPPDLILMDMQMPLMDGYETTRRIKAMKNVNIPIIAVTASAFQEDRQKTREAGTDGYLCKPFKKHELFDCIEACLGVQYVYE